MKLHRLGLGLIVALVVAVPAAAQSGRFDVGLRGVLSVADGEPANDIPGFGVFGHVRLGERWSLGLAVDRTEYDFEQPAKLLGIEQDPALEPIDVLAEATTFSAWVERGHRRPGGATTWFYGGGLGIATIDVPDAEGRRSDGGRFDIETDAGSEVVVSLLAGVRRDLGSRWFLEFALHADQHLADWQLTDRVSGARGAVDDYLTYGGHLGFGLRW